MTRHIIKIIIDEEQENYDGNIYFKGSQVGAFCPYDIVCSYFEFKLRYLKKNKKQKQKQTNKPEIVFN